MGGNLGYRPALDGIRAMSIALVLAFHLGAPWLGGGYLGVSVFFTLSGFLITSLLLTERTTTGRIDVRAFYVRRLRRLLPASLVCIAGIAVLAAIGTVAARSDLRGGVIGALFQVANWERLLGEQSYADLFLSPSPVDHFWSLAIEEQFYWVWPLAIAGLTAVAPHRVARWLVVAFVMLGASAFFTARLLGGDAAYFASWARFAEIVAGAALAALVVGRELPAWVSRLAAPCLALVVLLAAVTPAGRGWAYGGGLPLFALVSVGLILGVQSGEGTVARLLSVEPIPWIGRISYGLYLYHWPVFTILGDAPVGEKLTMTCSIAIVSYYFIERPIRTGQWLPAPSTYVHRAALGVLGVAVGVAVLVPTVETVTRSTEPVVIAANTPSVAPAVAPSTDVDVLSSPNTLTIAAIVRGPLALLGGVGAVTTVPPITAPPTTTTTTPPPRVVALFGDSIADWLLRDAAPTFARSDIMLVDAAVEGCDGAVFIPEARGRGGQILPLPDDCAAWTDAYPAVIDNPGLPNIDVAVLVLGYAPLVDRHLGGRWVGPCDELGWYLDDVKARVMYLRPEVDHVVLALPSWGGTKASYLSTDDHVARAGCIRDGLKTLATRLGVQTIDLADVLCPAGPAGECTALRERDGAHVDPDDAPLVLEWLLDRV